MVTGSCQVLLRLKRKCKERWSQEIETIIPCHTIPYQQTYQHTLPYLTLPYLTLPYVITFCYVMLRYIYIYYVYIYIYISIYSYVSVYIHIIYIHRDIPHVHHITSMSHRFMSPSAKKLISLGALGDVRSWGGPKK